ncbi:hypothetical protein VaNZ11_004434 [Volvox africanus]|uniref:Methyltransferase type 11 domain-containing protein n=1 Tax=Volvox africanus TaxID=51714 RepID=A0ABQ5RXY5_9CHLO|nr:hypothetical protein VaNZ11_004434 [Volvox africanus]
MTTTHAAASLSGLAAASVAVASNASRVALVPACMGMETQLRPAWQVVGGARTGALSVTADFPLGCGMQEASPRTLLMPLRLAVGSTRSASSFSNDIIIGKNGRELYSTGSPSSRDLAGVSSVWQLVGGWRDGVRTGTGVRHGRKGIQSGGVPSLAWGISWGNTERGGGGFRCSGQKNRFATPISILPVGSSGWVVGSPGGGVSCAAAAATNPSGMNLPLRRRCDDGDGNGDNDVAGRRPKHCATSAALRGQMQNRRDLGRCPASSLPHSGSVRQFHWSSSSNSSSSRMSVEDDSWMTPHHNQPPSRQHRRSPRDEGLGPPMDVFDRQVKALHRDRSAALVDSADPLLSAVSERLLDRLEDCRRSFPTAVVLGGAALPVLHQLAGGRAGVEQVLVVDTSQHMLNRVKREEAESRSRPGARPWPRVLYVRGDEEHLPLKPSSVNLIISCLGLHWANDLPGAMAQCRMALVPDGLFLSALFGGDTLQELRMSCALAQMERQGGVSAVVSPLAQVRDAGNLLTRADLRLPAVDVDRFHIGYPSALELVHHLRALGESNAAVNRRRVMSRDSALAAAAVYHTMFGSPEHGGSVSATFEVIFMTGWAPAASQPKAAKRGSATVTFQELADGLVQGGAAVGGTAEEGIQEGLTAPPPPPPQQQK